MITLYAHPFSPNSRKVHWALEESGAEYTYKTVNVPAGEQRSPEFLDLNPNGRVPVVDDDGFRLWESNAILWYLADKIGQGKLVSADVKERALTDQWMAWQAHDTPAAFARPWSMKFFARFGQPFDEARYADALKLHKKPLGVLQQHLAAHSYLVGDRFSIADIAVGELTALCPDAGIDLHPYDAVRAWLDRLAERPAWKKTRPQL
jgi:glutathione S-transferase